MELSEHSWVAVSIIIFMLLAFKHIRKFLVESLDNRENSIRLKLEEAISLSNEAEKLLQEHRLKHKNSDKDVKEIQSSAEAEVKYLKANAEKEFEEKLKAKKSNILNRISNKESKTLEKMRLESIQLAIKTSILIIQEHNSKEVTEKVLKDSINSIKNKLSLIDTAIHN